MYENAFNSIGRDLRAEEGIANELDYVEQISWVLFLKYLHDLESDRRDQATLEGKSDGTLTDANTKLGDTTTIKTAFVGIQRELYWD